MTRLFAPSFAEFGELPLYPAIEAALASVPVPPVGPTPGRAEGPNPGSGSA